MKVSLLIFLVALPASGATIVADSTSSADVQAALDSASNGDTVELPSGTSTWTATVTNYGKAITITGAGTNSTIIRDGVASASPLWSMSLPLSGTLSVSAIQINDNGGSEKPNGVVTFSGQTNYQARLKLFQMFSNDPNGVCFFFSDVIGVCSSNTTIQSSSQIHYYIYHENWDGVAYADGSYADPVDWGSENYLYIEDSYMAFTGGAFYAFIDAYRGARYGVRYTICVSGWLEAHGTDSSARRRGTHSMEVYNNLFDGLGTIQDYYINMRSGTVLSHGNTLTNYTGNAPGIIVAAYRMRAPFPPWGSSDGANPWDVNQSGGEETGTATGGGSLTLTNSSASWTNDFWIGFTLCVTNIFTATSGATNSVTVSGAGWTTDEWDDYEFADATDAAIRSVVTSNTSDTLTLSASGGQLGDYRGVDGANTGQFILQQCSEISDNTATGVTILDQSVSSSIANYSFESGDTYVIRKVTHSLDQAGRVGGTSLGGVLFPDPPGGWNDQTTEPSYEWDNLFEGGATRGFVEGSSVTRENEHWFEETEPVGYTPYTYPHPLIVSPFTPVRKAKFGPRGRGRF